MAQPAHLLAACCRLFGRNLGTYIQYAVQDYGACHDVQGQRGLHRVQEIVDEWRGRLIIRSSRSSVTWHKGGITMQDNLAFLPGTQVAITVREPGTHQQGTRA